jgi:DNA-binding PadR family transcriptional regulator
MTYESDVIIVKIHDEIQIYGNTTRGKRWLEEFVNDPHRIKSIFTEDFIKFLDEHDITYEESYRIPDLPE